MPPHSQHRGAATVELAVALPLLTFLFLVAVDFCRVFYFSQVVTNCTRNGALYATDPVAAGWSRYRSLEEAVRADAGADIAGQLTITSTTGTDSVGSYTQITVSYPFTTLTNYLGIARTTTITRQALARPAALVPN